MSEPIGVLLLPCKLEQFELSAHARELLRIPRVIALEPSPRRVPRLLRDSLPVRQARRLRLPGEPQLVVLYHPRQYPLARALCGRYESELWYVRPDAATLRADATDPREELLELDQLACERSTHARVVEPTADPVIAGEAPLTGEPALVVADQQLRIRLRELEIVSPRPFVPGARIDVRRA